MTSPIVGWQDHPVSENQTSTTSVVDPGMPNPGVPYIWQVDVYRGFYNYMAPLVLALGTVNNLLAVLVLQSKGMRSSGTNFTLTVLAAADTGVLYTALLRSLVLHYSEGTVGSQFIPLSQFNRELLI